MDRAKEKIKGIKVGSDAYQNLQREMQIMKAMIEMTKTTKGEIKAIRLDFKLSNAWERLRTQRTVLQNMGVRN